MTTMRNKNIFRICGLALVSAMTLSSCSDILDEQPRSSYTPGFFATEDGVKGGLTALYSHLRNIYGQAYYYNSCETGTDEYTWAQSGADDNFKAADMSVPGLLNKSNCRADAIWGQSFSDINTALAVIENASGVGIDDALVAEAKFFLGFHYFNLVQTFGGVPLDLGGGELHSNTAPKRSSVRNTVADVYTKAIFPSLEDAVAKLPDVSRLPGTVNKTTARLILAKAYLTYGWWLENPNDIPTYPECSRDKSQAASYFQKALQKANEAIEDKNTANGLEDYFYLANIAQNDRNKEWLLWADHTEKSAQYNGGDLGYGGGGAPDNFAGWFVTWNYCAWLTGKDQSGNVIVPVQREASQPLGRPWTRMAATVEGLSKFTNTEMDSRWDGTFTAEYRVNFQKTNKDFRYVEGANGSHIGAYDTYLKFLPADVDDSQIVYGDNAGVQAGAMPGEDAWVISAKTVSRSRYPGVWKLGPSRYDYDFENSFGSPNAGSTRPYVIAKFSELYLVGAEAAVKLGDNNEATRLINFLRARAGKWNYIVNAGNPSELHNMSGDDLRKLPLIADNSKAMQDATPATITIDYILDERLREFWGEGYRWNDLIRTQKWNEVAGTYHICNDFTNDMQTVKRDIQKFHYLRPIPQGQIDALEMTDEEKAAYQNPGY